VFCAKLLDGSEKWTLDSSSIDSVVAGSDGTIYIGATEDVFALDAERHWLDWSYRGGTPVMAPDGTIYSSTHEGDLFARNPPSHLEPQSSPLP